MVCHSDAPFAHIDLMTTDKVMAGCLEFLGLWPRTQNTNSFGKFIITKLSAYCITQLGGRSSERKH